jgi:hypothetical protein
MILGFPTQNNATKGTKVTRRGSTNILLVFLAPLGRAMSPLVFKIKAWGRRKRGFELLRSGRAGFWAEDIGRRLPVFF